MPAPLIRYGVFLAIALMNVAVSAEEGMVPSTQPLPTSQEAQFGEIQRILAQIDSAPENEQLDTRHAGTQTFARSATESSGASSTNMTNAHDMSPNRAQPAMGMGHMKDGMPPDPQTFSGEMGMGDMDDKTAPDPQPSTGGMGMGDM